MEMKTNKHTKTSNAKWLFLTLLYTLAMPNGICQVDSLTQLLRQKLHLDVKPTVSVATFLPDCWPIDSSEQYLVREVQADGDEVLDVLEAIIAQRDSSFFQPVLGVYRDYIRVFRAETWSLLWKHDKKDACSRRHETTYITFIGEQMRILYAMENTLKALNFSRKQFTGQQIFDYIISSYERSFDDMRDKKVVYEIGKDYFSEEVMKSIHSGAGYNYPGRRVSSFGAYEDEALPYFLRFIREFKFQDFKYKENEAYDKDLFLLQRVLRTATVSNKRVNPELDSCFIAVSETFIRNQKVSWLYNALGDTPISDAATEYFVRLLFEHPTLLKLDFYMRDMMLRTMWHESRKSAIKNILLTYLEEGDDKDRGNVMYMLRVFADNDVALTCMRLLNDKSTPPVNPGLVAELLDVCLTNPELSDAIRIRVTNTLKNIRR